jgi:hypothetical protein
MAVPTWLGNLKREIVAPDLCGSLAAERSLLDSSEPSTNANTPFTETEQKQIKVAVEELRAYIAKTQTLSEESALTVNAKLDYLISASKQLGRIHWKDIFVSTLIGIAWQLALPGPDFHDFIFLRRTDFSPAARIRRLASPPLLI